MITKKQWIAFGLCAQDKKNKRIAADLMGITYEEVSNLLADLKKQEPGLFPVENERQNIRQYLSSEERKRYNADIVSYDTRKDMAENVDTEIRQKF